jgi:hypothetical protein
VTLDGKGNLVSKVKFRRKSLGGNLAVLAMDETDALRHRVGSDLRADRSARPFIAKRGRLGDATLPALGALDRRQAVELSIVANYVKPDI